MKEWLFSKDTCIAIISVILGVFIPFIFNQIKKLVLKTIEGKKALKITIDDIGQIQNENEFGKVLRELIKNSKNLDRLEIRTIKDKKLLQDIPRSEIESYENDCKREEERVKDTLYLLLSPQSKSSLFYWGAEKDEDIERIVFKTLKCWYDVVTPTTRKIGLDIINNKVKDKVGNPLVCVIYADEKLIQSAIKGTGLTNGEISIDRDLLLWSSTIGNVSDKKWVSYEFLPQMITAILSKVGHEGIYSQDFSFSNLYDKDLWKIGLH